MAGGAITGGSGTPMAGPIDVPDSYAGAWRAAAITTAGSIL
ncbi:hypothetical protein [[Mycobacterium] holstebronense]|uniref:Uncharacterized protein n=1 Tax=[Mycobacterium] holstebronense TaxID=3064288 RepID=A0ABM9M3H7_9MYCO|nr:hypothetical protein [Mycolicibacter sp. MU0102]CAJ1509511.1 hypothetical protein MU0102_003764 [Mycolicibacter sp. MU0102]